MKDRTLLESPGNEPGDAIDRTLQEVRALIESTVLEHRARQSRSALVAGVGMENAALRAAAEEVVERARRTVDLALSASDGPLSAVHTTLTELAAGAGDGVRVRVLCVRPEAGWDARLTVRVTRVALPNLIIADGRTALACAEADGLRQGSVVEDSAVVRALHGMFTSVWGGAVPASTPFDFGNRARADMVRRVLERLRDGVTDEAAARELAVSVRTYRRYVTGILELLGASSRFQAGVRATELGILRDR